MKKEYFTASRTIVIALACVTAMSLTACGGDDEPEINEPEINKPEINKPESDKPESEDILYD